MVHGKKQCVKTVLDENIQSRRNDKKPRLDTAGFRKKEAISVKMVKTSGDRGTEGHLAMLQVKDGI